MNYEKIEFLLLASSNSILTLVYNSHTCFLPGKQSVLTEKRRHQIMTFYLEAIICSQIVFDKKKLKH